VRSLEPKAKELSDLQQGEIVGAFQVPSRDDPGSSVVYVVARQAPDARGDNGARWLSDHMEFMQPVLSKRKVTLCNIIFPGTWPSNAVRQRHAGTTVRLVSAVHHLWADRIRVTDPDGNVDQPARAKLLQALGGTWTDLEERSYTEPALSAVHESDERTARALSSLLQGQPDVLEGGITVIYGPGGIGKTFFLRRVSNRMSRTAVADLTQPIPVFAALPLLLHVDVLETWMSHAGIRLPIADIRILLEKGVIVPILDALDELVSGQARDGSRQFLRQLKKTIEGSGRAVLSSRDYYLNLDPLVQDELGGKRTAQLSVGFFSKAGRRRYIQMRTGLDEQAAARWAAQLETQAAETLEGVAEADVESLIGHPLFLDAFSKLILDLPADRRAVGAENFRLTSPDVFGEIVQKVLERERAKFAPSWKAKFGDHVSGFWSDPFEPQVQTRLLARLVLMVAADGAAAVARRESDDSRYRQLRHGVFTFTAGAPAGVENPRAALRTLIQAELGTPEVQKARSQEESDKLIEAMLNELATFYLQHTLADTRPDPPPDLVFATRHRAYFDYLLAEQLLRELQTALGRADEAAGLAFIDWCLKHNIFEQEQSEAPPFASCLDFVLWHKSAVNEALKLVSRFFEAESTIEPLVASYVFSLVLAVLLRAVDRTKGLKVRRQDFSGADSLQVDVVPAIVPAITGLHIADCSLPKLVLDATTVRDTTLIDVDIAGLQMRSCRWTNVRFEGVECRAWLLTGTSHFHDCVLDLDGFEPSNFDLAVDAQATFWGCQLSPELEAHLTELGRLRAGVVELKECRPIPRRDQTEQSPGQAFVNRLVSLVRKHGHGEYGVYEPKLRGLTRATGKTFPEALAVLERHEAIGRIGPMVYLTESSERHLYSGKLRDGMRSYSDVASYWNPIVKALDSVLK